MFKDLGQECTEEGVKAMCDEFCEETRKPNTLQVRDRENEQWATSSFVDLADNSISPVSGATVLCGQEGE